MASTVTLPGKLGDFAMRAMGLDGPSDPAVATAWVTATAYSVGDYRRPATPNGWVYKCIKAISSSGSEPSWPTTVGEVVADGTGFWQAMHKGVKMSLFNTAPGFDADTDQYYADITVANELSTANGYTNGGKCVTDGRIGTYDSVNNRTPYQHDAITWSASGGAIVARYLILRLDRGTNANSPILTYHDMGASQTAVDGADWRGRPNSSNEDGAAFYV